MTKPHDAIVFALRDLPPALRAPASDTNAVLVRVCARALEGMQKEAMVAISPDGTGWRMLCDEGPYLEGTDLAPPPLAYFSAGMAAHHARLMLRAARQAGLDLGGLALAQEAWYTMEGSALRGTMTGGALPAELSVAAAGVAEGDLDALARAALANSVAEALMARPSSGLFSIARNGAAMDTGRVAPAQAPPDWGPDLFTGLQPDRGRSGPPEIVRKLHAAETSRDPTHGKGASLQESQKRILHLHSTLAVREDGLLGIEVHLERPTGSTFRFLAAGEDPGERRAPGGLSYLAAGIALCFMTQMGRYAKIARLDLPGYAVLQDLRAEREPTRIRPVITHVQVQSSEDEDTVRRIIDMSEQTCFLHAACRSANPTRLTTEPETHSQRKSES